MKAVVSVPTTGPQTIVGANFLGVARGSQWKALALFLGVSDTCMVFLGFCAAYWARFQTFLPIFQLNVVPSWGHYSRLTLVLTLGWVSLFALSGLYNRQNLLRGTREVALVANACTWGMALVMAADFLWPELLMARGWLLIAWVMTFLLVVTGRFILRRGVRILRKEGFFTSAALIVGANAEGRLLAEQFSNRQYSGLELIGFVDETLPANTLVYKQLHTFGQIDCLEKVIAEHRVEELILASSALSQDQLISIFGRLGFSPQVNLRVSTGLYEMIATGSQVTEFACVPLVSVNKMRLTGLDQFLKTALDYSLATAALIILSPLLLILAVLVRLDSPGPALHRRRVMGVNGRQFDAYKFRTMYVNGDEVLARDPALQAEYLKNHKLRNDPRVTRLGKLLRRTSLDEIPQLINILKNEMSLVGPRMICPEEMAHYQQAGMNLLTVKPGITGLWQVSGRSELPYEERVRLDMTYIRNWSIWLDLHLLLRTVPAVLSRKGAF